MSANARGRCFGLETLEPRRLLSFTFSPPIVSPIGPATLLAAGDFTNNGFADLLVRGSSTSSNVHGHVQLFRGGGNGTFPNAGTLVQSGPNVSSIAVADVNNDGNLDAVFTNDLVHGRVTLALGNGNGEFFPGTAAVILSWFAGSHTSGVVVADFNGDNLPDLLVSNRELWSMPNSTIPSMYGAGLLINNGHGSFQPVRQIPLPAAQTGVAVGDINGDGIPDAVMSGFIHTATSTAPVPFVHVLIGTSGGAFHTSGFIPFNHGQIAGMALADLNGNGRDDLLLLQAPHPHTHSIADTNVRTFFANHDGSFTAGPVVNPHVARPAGLSVADFDRDGNVDVAVAGLAPVTVHATSGAVSVLRGHGDGSFAPPMLFRTHGMPIAQTTADLNGNHRTDIVTGGSTGVSALLNRPAIHPLEASSARESVRDLVGVLD